MGNKKGLHCHMVLEFKKSIINYLENLSSPVGKSLNNQDLMFQSRNVEVSNHQVVVIVILTHTTDKAMMERRQV